VLLRIVSLAVDNSLFFVLVSLLKFNVYVSRVGLSITIILATYIINKLFIFRDAPNPTSSDGDKNNEIP
jgi:putative flippase GtrA